MKLYLTVILLFFMGKSFSQTLSKEEAIHIAQQLYEVEILSEKGRDSLHTTILFADKKDQITMMKTNGFTLLKS
ncbi:hypothetical protein [Chondrinema litorale]|uniref:hypothetical protein n=1 Tax=Chondrinema litorale TaxID=2994555 RepID=UPI0025433004|nr:hypothetical protein [Chondrinema litorale]UZR95231.1 hypothetical protein OQ292_05285 [Chondrinema litorale]